MSGLTPARPTALPRGAPLPIMGRLDDGKARLRVRAKLGGRELEDRFELVAPDASGNELLAGFWARAFIGALERGTVDRSEVVALSQRYGVMSRYTSFLVLENDAAYRRFLVERRQHASVDEAERARRTARLTKSRARLADVLGAETNAKGQAGKKEAAVEALFGAQGNAAIAGLFGADVSGGELQTLLGGISGAQAGESYGVGGLGLYGSGPGGGGTGVAAMGAGAVETRGRGAGDAAYGSGEGGLGGKGDREVGVSLGKPLVYGALDKEIIRRVVRENQAQLRYCYERELTRTPGLRGEIAVKWVITSTGLVRQAQVVDSAMDNASVESCLTARINGWRFPKPKGGGIVVVTFPFDFRDGLDVDELERRRDRLSPYESTTLLSFYLRQGRRRELEELLVTVARRAPAPEHAAVLLRILDEADLHADAARLFSAWRERGALPDRTVFDLFRYAPLPSLAHERRAAALRLLKAGERDRDLLDMALGKDERDLEVARAVVESCRAPKPAEGATCLVWLERVERFTPEAEPLLDAARAARLQEIFRERAHDWGNASLIAQEAALLTELGFADEGARALSEMVEASPHDHATRASYAALLEQRGEIHASCAQLAAAVQLDARQRDTSRGIMQLRRRHPQHADAVRACVVDGVSSLPVQRAVSLVLTWEDERADVDLHVRERGGEHVYYGHSSSQIGGLLYYDITDGYGPEIYALGDGPSGRYDVSVVYYRGAVRDVSGTLTILRDAGAPDERREEIPFTLTSPHHEREIPLASFEL